MRLKLAEAEDLETDYKIRDKIRDRQSQVDNRLAELGVETLGVEEPTALRLPLSLALFRRHQAARHRYRADRRRRGLVLRARARADQGSGRRHPRLASTTGLASFRGTHGIGHTRMATESDVDIRSAHPYWAYPYNDIAVVHNGQITNYWIMRREMERLGHRFMSNCDSELLAVYTANNLEQGATLEDSLKASIKEIDGVFTYLVATDKELGLAKDTMAAKPMVLYESDDLVALASEEVAIRAIVPREIDTSDPYDEEVRVWQR